MSFHAIPLPDPTAEGLEYASLPLQEKQSRWDIASMSANAYSESDRSDLLKSRVMAAAVPVPALDVYKKDDGTFYTKVVMRLNTMELSRERSTLPLAWRDVYPLLELEVHPLKHDQKQRATANIRHVMENPNLGKWIYLKDKIGLNGEDEVREYLELFAPLLSRAQYIVFSSRAYLSVETKVGDAPGVRAMWDFFLTRAPDLRVINATIPFVLGIFPSRVPLFSHNVIGLRGTRIRVVVDTDVIDPEDSNYRSWIADVERDNEMRATISARRTLAVLTSTERQIGNSNRFSSQTGGEGNPMLGRVLGFLGP